MFAPNVGDVVLRGTYPTGFVVLDALTEEALYSSNVFDQALHFARARAGNAVVWQQHIDERGRPVSEPRVFPKAAAFQTRTAETRLRR